jgi:hypothetical protein
VYFLGTPTSLTLSVQCDLRYESAIPFVVFGDSWRKRISGCAVIQDLWLLIEYT